MYYELQYQISFTASQKFEVNSAVCMRYATAKEQMFPRKSEFMQRINFNKCTKFGIPQHMHVHLRFRELLWITCYGNLNIII